MDAALIGRRKPYSARGISRVPCVKCGQPSEHQWRICATGKWHPTCIKCDVELNKLVATWAFGKKTADMLIQDYERSSY